MLPAEGSYYYDYLIDFPVGVSMVMHLHTDSDGDEELEFIVKRLRAGSWSVPFADDPLSTRELFEHVLERMEGEDYIRVNHGKDPRAVKKEYLQRAEAGLRR